MKDWQTMAFEIGDSGKYRVIVYQSRDSLEQTAVGTSAGVRNSE